MSLTSVANLALNEVGYFTPRDHPGIPDLQVANAPGSNWCIDETLDSPVALRN